MNSLWHRWFHWLIAKSYFDRLEIRRAERLPRSGPVMYLSPHRNGAVDAFVFHSVLTQSVFMVSSRLCRSLLGRLFFGGIAVVRDKDHTPGGTDSATNQRAMDDCLALLGRGGELFIFPEGTSALGPRQLPFKSGAPRLAERHLAAGGELQVVPLGIFYESPESFRSRVEVVVGEPVSTTLPESLTQAGRVRELKRRFTAALEEVGVNVPTPQHQEQSERLAGIATLGTPRSFAATLKKLESAIPVAAESAWHDLEPALARSRLCLHQGVPLFPMSRPWLYLLMLLVLAALAFPGVALNFPPLLAAWWAGRKFPDDRNVVSLWKILVGMPAFLLWSALLLTASLWTGQLGAFALWCGATVLSLNLWYRVKKLAVTVHNGFRHPELGPRLLAFRELVLKEIPQ